MEMVVEKVLEYRKTLPRIFKIPQVAPYSGKDDPYE